MSYTACAAPERQTLPDTDPAENPVVEFDFSGELDAVDAAVVSVVVERGRDADPAALLEGPPQIDGVRVYQRIASSAAVPGVDYRLRCEATHGTDLRVRAGILPVRTA